MDNNSGSWHDEHYLGSIVPYTRVMTHDSPKLSNTHFLTTH